MADGAVTPPRGYSVEPQQASTLPPGYAVEGQQQSPDDQQQVTSDIETEHALREDLGNFVQGATNIVSAPGQHLKNALSALSQKDFKGAAEHFGKFLHPENEIAESAIDAQMKSSAQSTDRMMDAAKQGDVLGTMQHAAGVLPFASQVDAAMTNYQKEPSRANLVHIITTALPVLLGGAMKVGGEATELGEQVVKGKNIAEPVAQGALREAAGTREASLRESLTEPIAKSEETAKGMYKQIDDATGSDIKALGTKLQAANRAIRKSVSDEEDVALEQRRTDIENRIQDAKQQAISKGVDPKILDQADEEFKHMSALTDVEKRVFKNVKVVKGNAARGAGETVDIDRAVEELQKLQDNEKYGGPRLEQAFGKDGAQQLLEKFYDAQKQGVHAMKMQKVAKWVAGIVGAGAVAKGAGVLSSKE